MNILIIGDVMIDINHISEIKRNAPEANIPIYNILDTTYILGGASNVAQNLKNLDTNVEVISVIGNDFYRDKMIELFESKQINHRLFVDETRKTTQKNRIFVNNTLYVRNDIESTHDIPKDIENDILSYIATKEKIDAIVISDYDKGVVTESLCQKVIAYGNLKHTPTFVDPKIKNYLKYKGCFLLKPNQQEAEIISGETNMEKILDILIEKIECKNVLLTRGKEGMILNHIFNKIEHDCSIQLVDVTGAGDVVMAVLVHEYLKNKDLLQASKIANYIGGKSVGVIGNYNVNLNDIQEYNERMKREITNKIIYDYDVVKLEQISQKKNVVFTNGCFDILHSAHIELLKFSKKQGNILVVGLNSDESIKRLKGPTRPINDIHERTKILSLFDFIDYIVIFDEDTPFNILNILQPDILVKGGDYSIENIIGKEHVKEVVLFDYIQNKSSTRVIEKIKIKNKTLL